MKILLLLFFTFMVLSQLKAKQFLNIGEDVILAFVEKGQFFGLDCDRNHGQSKEFTNRQTGRTGHAKQFLIVGSGNNYLVDSGCKFVRMSDPSVKNLKV